MRKCTSLLDVSIPGAVAERSLWTFASVAFASHIASASQAALTALSYAALKSAIVVGLVGITSRCLFLGALFPYLVACYGGSR